MKYWFYLNKDTFFWINDQHLLIYNSTNTKSINYDIDPLIKETFHELSNPKNLYCISLSDKQLQNENIHQFIQKVESIHAGKIVKQVDMSLRPVIIPPILKFQPNLTDIAGFNNLNENILLNLHDLFISLIDKNSNTHLNWIQLKKLLSSLSSQKIYLIGKELILFQNAIKLLQFLVKKKISFSIQLEINSEIDNIINYIQELKLEFHFEYKIILSKKYTLDQIKKIISKFQQLSCSIKWEIKISSIEDYRHYESIFKELNIDSVFFSPVYNTKNNDFFNEYILLNENDLQNYQISKKEIFKHQILNTNYFGKLYVDAFGKIYAHSKFDSIGTIDEDIRSIIYKELTSGNSWLKVRNQAPCNNCIYQWICPSPSDLELELKQNKLCTLSTF
jgi:pseudo-rSAM protein